MPRAKICRWTCPSICYVCDYEELETRWQHHYSYILYYILHYRLILTDYGIRRVYRHSCTCKESADWREKQEHITERVVANVVGVLTAIHNIIIPAPYPAVRAI